MHKPAEYADKLAIGTGNLMCWLFLIAAILSVYEVVCDVIFGSPTIWVYDLVTILLATCFLFAGAFTEAKDQHVRITIILDRFPTPIFRIVNATFFLLSTGFAAAFAYVSSQLALRSLAIFETSGRAWDVPMPVFIKSAMALASILLTVQLFCRFLKAVSERGASRPTT